MEEDRTDSGERPDVVNARVSPTSGTALHVAVGAGMPLGLMKKLVDKMSDESLAIQNDNGFTVLHEAARTGNLKAAEILVQKNSELLSIYSYKDLCPVHIAAGSGHRKTLEFLMSRTRSLDEDDMGHYVFYGRSGLELLIHLINADYFDMAVRLVEEYPHLARIRSDLSSTHVLLCTLQREKAFSVEAQLNLYERIIYYCIHLEMEMESQVKHPSPDIENPTSEIPSSWRRRVVPKLNSSLLKVIKLLVPQVIKRVYDKKVMRRDALRLVKSLCKHMAPSNFKEAEDFYSKAMLMAASLGIEEVVEAIVDIFPRAIYFRHASTYHNFVELAVINRCETVFNLIHQYHYSDAIYSSGSRILFLAASLAPPYKLNLVSGAALQLQREIQWFKEVDKFANKSMWLPLNEDGKTAEMVFTEEHRELKVEGEKWMKDTANSLTITAALIVTVVFASAITVPGGNESSGIPVWSTQPAFALFAVSDAISLFTSTTSLLMFLSILTSRFAEQDFLYALPKRLCIGLATLFISILFMMTAFGSTLYLVFGRNKAWILVPVAVLACLPITAFVLLQFPLLLALISSTYGGGIFGKQSHRVVN